jgi:hypothetical protein
MFDEVVDVCRQHIPSDTCDNKIKPVVMIRVCIRS